MNSMNRKASPFIQLLLKSAYHDIRHTVAKYLNDLQKVGLKKVQQVLRHRRQNEKRAGSGFEKLGLLRIRRNWQKQVSFFRKKSQDSGVCVSNIEVVTFLP